MLNLGIAMQKGHRLQFHCPDCQHGIDLALFDLEQQRPLECNGCQKSYAIQDPVLYRQLAKFEALCRQIADSEEILGNTAVGIDVNGNHVSIPYKLLLTRLTSVLKLNLGDREASITFRLEPLKDLT